MESLRRRTQNPPVPYDFKPKMSAYAPMFKGFIRSAPLHRFHVGTVHKILSFVALRPAVFGLDDVATCVVNPVSLLSSSRSKSEGVTCFGPARGCKTVVIPNSATGNRYDVMDVKLIEPILKWNPSMETLFLSKDCEPMALDIGKYLSKSRNLRTVIVPDWDDAVALRNLCLPIKSIEVIDAHSVDTIKKKWGNPESIQAASELIEMHPKLHVLFAKDPWRCAFMNAMEDSRCKHNMPVIQGGCSWSGLWQGTFHLVALCLWGTMMTWLLHKHLGNYVCKKRGLTPGQIQEKRMRDALWCVGFLIGFAALILGDQFMYPRYGRYWMHWVGKPVVLMRRRLDPILTR